MMADPVVPGCFGADGPGSGREAILALARRIAPQPGSAWAWYQHDPIGVLDGLTAAALVAQGRAREVYAFLLWITAAERAAAAQAGPDRAAFQATGAVVTHGAGGP